MAEGGDEACCVCEVLAWRSGDGICWRMVAVVLGGIVASGWEGDAVVVLCRWAG
jgi:hypothetical protein